MIKKLFKKIFIDEIDEYKQIIGKEYLKLTKDIWYYYLSYNECGEEDLIKRSLKWSVGWDCCEIRPFILIGRRKFRGKFKVVGNKCFYKIKNKKFIVSLGNCSFGYETKYYHHKTINFRKRKGEYNAFTMTPSHYGEIYIYLKILKEKIQDAT